MDHELLNENNKNGIRNYYAVLKTSSKLICGEWTFELIYIENILCSKKVNYNVLNTSYKKQNYYAKNTAFRVDIKM